MENKTNSALTVLATLLGIVATIFAVLKDAPEVLRLLPVHVHPALFVLLALAAFVLVILLQRSNPLWPKLKSMLAQRIDLLAHWNPLLSLACLALSVLLVGLSLETGIKLHKLAELSSTTYIGAFPQNMVAINNLIRNTQQELTIAVDFPGYGQYSNPREFETYSQALLGLGEKVKLLVYDTPRAESAAKAQFSSVNFDEFRKKPNWGAFFRANPGRAQPALKDDFLQMLTSLNREFRTRLAYKGVQVSEVNQTLPVFVWIRDGEEAIFSFYNLEGAVSEVSFQTENPQIISILNEIYSKYSKPVGGSE